jgi:hypothetical protein
VIRRRLSPSDSFIIKDCQSCVNCILPDFGERGAVDPLAGKVSGAVSKAVRETLSPGYRIGLLRGQKRRMLLLPFPKAPTGARFCRPGRSGAQAWESGAIAIRSFIQKPQRGGTTPRHTFGNGSRQTLSAMSRGCGTSHRLSSMISKERAASAVSLGPTRLGRRDCDKKAWERGMRCRTQI